jgi:hypothetical protein
MDPTTGCDECGTTDAQHDEGCLLALIEQYGDLRNEAGQLAGSRYGHFVGDRNHEAAEVFARIREALRSQ